MATRIEEARHLIQCSAGQDGYEKIDPTACERFINFFRNLFGQDSVNQSYESALREGDIAGATVAIKMGAEFDSSRFTEVYSRLIRNGKDEAARFLLAQTSEEASFRRGVGHNILQGNFDPETGHLTACSFAKNRDYHPSLPQDANDKRKGVEAYIAGVEMLVSEHPEIIRFDPENLSRAKTLEQIQGNEHICSKLRKRAGEILKIIRGYISDQELQRYREQRFQEETANDACKPIYGSS